MLFRSPPLVGEILLWVLLALLAADIAGTVLTLCGVRSSLPPLENLNSRLAALSVRLGEWILRRAEGRIQKAHPGAVFSRRRERTTVSPFARGASFYSILLLFFIGGVAGDLAETIFCRLKMGWWMSRSSVVYGPFSLVWGFGAVLLTVSGALNIFLNWVLIYGKLGAPMLGCAGAAIATLISRAFEVAVLCVYARFSRRLPLMPRALLHPGRVIAKDFAKYALPVVCNECLWSLAFSLYTVIMGHMDNNTPILSAYTIAGNLQRMLTPASFAAGGAAAVLIGREIGRGNRDQVQRKAWVLDGLALVVGLVCMGIIALVRNVLLRPYILPLMHMEGAACDIAMYMMGVLMLVQPVSSVSLTNIVGVLRGGGDVRYAMLCDVGPLYAVCLPLAALTALVWKLDIRYVYPLMSIDVIVQLFLVMPRLRSGKWIHDVTRGAGELET